MSTREAKAVSWMIAGICSFVFHLMAVPLLLWVGGSATPDKADQCVADAKVEESAPTTTPTVTEQDTPPEEVDTGKADVPSPAAGRALAPRTPSSKVKNYKVRSGDNLTRIAHRCGATNAELAELNGMSEKQLANLKVGQIIKIKVRRNEE